MQRRQLPWVPVEKEYQFDTEDGKRAPVYHTYTVMAPDPFVAPYHSFLLERMPKAQPAEPRTWRKDEYPD